MNTPIRSFRPLIVLVALALACGDHVTPKSSDAIGTQTQPILTGFGAGSLIIPMDSTYQDVGATSGILKAYGLVNALTLQGIQVSWAIDDGKAVNGVDFTASATNVSQATSTGTITNFGYFGGPFIIDASEAPTALAYIQKTWNKSSVQTVVHQASASFTADIQEVIAAAPRIAVDEDGYENLAFNYLNAAGITDSQGNAWPAAVETTYTTPDVISPTAIGTGALLNPDGTPVFTNLTSMHYDPTHSGSTTIVAPDATVLAVRNWLAGSPLTMAVMECLAITAFENNTNHGFFLTTAGLTGSSTKPTAGTLILPDNPLDQLFIPTGTTLTTDSGAVAQYTLNGGAFKTGVQYLAAGSATTTPPTQIIWMSGHMDGNNNNGVISYLAGHDYGNGDTSPPLPITTNPLTNGVRLYLDAFLQTAAIQSTFQPIVNVTMSSPAVNAGGTITWTINYTNTNAFGVAGAAVLTDTLPTGVTGISATGGGTVSGQTVTWNLVDLKPSSSGSVTVTGTVSTDGTWSNSASLAWTVGRTPHTTLSNTTQNLFPTTTITSGPASTTNSTSATFSFTSSASGATFQCKVDTGAYTACTSPDTISGQSSAAHTFYVESTIPGGNTDLTPASWSWTIDTTPPTVSIVTRPTNPTNVAIPVFTFSSNESPVTYQCELDAATSYTACPSVWPALDDGSHTLAVEAVDSAGNVSTTPASYTWVIDTTPPRTTIVTGPSSPTNSTSAAFTLSANESPVTYQCKLDTGAYATCTASPTFPVAAGAHTLTARATDAAGNTDPTPPTWSWTVDTTKPTVSIVTKPSNPTNSTTAVFTFSSSKSPVTYQCTLDSTAYPTCPDTFTGLSNGSHTLQVTATDQAGNVSTPASYTWLIDTTLPVVAITTGPAAFTHSTSASFTVSVTDTQPITSYVCSLDGHAYTTCSATPTLTGLTDGAHTLLANVVDAAGNSASPPGSWSWSVGTQIPSAQITNGPTSPTNDSTATFTFTSSASPVTFLCELTGQTSYTACPVPSVFSSLADGSYTLTIEAEDEYGNVSAPSTPWSWTVDTVPPTVSITSGPSQFTNSTSATFVITAATTEAPIASYICSLDGAPFTTCSANPTLTGILDGSHTLEANVIDTAGNSATPPASWSWTVGTSVPTIQIVSGPDTYTNDTSATFTFSSSASPVTYLCELNGATPYTPCPTTFTGLLPGPQTLSVEAKDEYGNVSTPATASWTVDTTAPGISITSAPPALTNSNAATFEFTATDTIAIASYQCALDGVAITCTSPQTYTNLIDGPHTFQVTAFDVAGNQAAPPATYTWTVDTTPPTVSIEDGPPSETDSTTATFTFSSDESPVTYLCEIDGATTYTPCPTSFTGLSNGSHTITVEAEDGAGNISSPSPPYTWTVDTIGPTIQITAGPSQPYSNSPDAVFTLVAQAQPNLTITGYLCAMDSTAFTSCPGTPSFTGLLDGPHTLLASAIDSVGNQSATPASYTWTIGTVVPTTTIVNKPPNPSNSTSGTFSFSSTASPATFLCELDNAATFTACTNPVTFTNLGAGDHTLQVESEDEYGNISDPVSYTWTIQLTAPVVSIDSGPNHFTSSTTANFTLSSPTATTFLCAVDGVAFVTCTTSPSYTVTVGSHTFLASGLDAAGNQAPTVSYTWQVGTQAPNTTFVTTPPNPSFSSTAVFTYGSNESPVTFQCELDSATPFTTCPASFTGLADGSHTLTVRAKDQYGNVDPAPPSYTWVVDTTPPDTTIVTGPPALTNETTAHFTFSSNKSPVTYQCSIDGSAVAACDVSASFPGLHQGPHTLQVQAVDSSGLADPTPAVAEWTIDTTAPITTIVTGPDHETTATTATFTFTANKSPATFQCALDTTATWTACETPDEFDNVAAGTHVFHVRAKDAAGNVDPNPPSYTWTVNGPAVTTAATPDQLHGARLGCQSSGLGPWALLWLLPAFLLRRRARSYAKR